jgi:GNAT superfamily N-acetyltransferase
VTIAIRPAVADDAPALVAADPFAQTSAERRTQISHWVDSGQCFVAEREGDIVGYCVLTREFFHSFFIELVMVGEGERRAGIGTAMIQYLIGMVPPGEKLWTSTNASNAPMRTLLEKLGFVRSGAIEHLDEGDPELVFVRLP